MNLQLLWNLLLILSALAILCGLIALLFKIFGKRIRRTRLVLLCTAVLTAYILTGIFVAYLRHPTVSQSYQNSLDFSAFYGDSPGKERVALVPTNQAALEERLRLFSLAEHRIILSTFDFVADNSGLDVIASLYAAAAL